MIYFDAIVNLMHDIWKKKPLRLSELFSLGQMKFMGTTQGMPQKGIIFRKKLSRKFSNALFRELERYYGFKFLQTGEIYLNQSLRKKIRRFLFETLSDRDDYVEVDTLTQVLKFSSWLISTHSLVYL